MGGLRDHQSWRAELPAYLLGSLLPEEVEAVERHLDGCERCRAELRWLQPAIDALPESVPQLEPPPQLRERLMAEVRADSASAPEPASAPAPRRRRFAGRPLGFVLRPAAGLAAVALIAAVVAGYALRGEGGSATTTTKAGGGAIRATLERSGDSGTLVMTGLRPLPRSRVYEAWVQHGRRVEPSTLFEARNDGSAATAIPHQLDGADAVMVTVEPRGGSERPTSPPVLRFALRD
jgi:anti-sigma-K factor RskA